MQTQLTVHVNAGIFGPLLAIIHTGHKFESTTEPIPLLAKQRKNKSAGL